MTSVELWSDWQCNGGVAAGRLRVVSGSWGLEVDGSDACELAIVPDTRTTPALRDVIRITDGAGVVYEYRIQSIGRTLANNTRVIKGLSPLADLGTAGPVRQITAGAATTYLTGAMAKTATEYINDSILTNLAADELSWLSLGTVSGALDVARYIEVQGAPKQRLQVLREMEKVFGAEARLRRNGSAGYYLDFLTRVGSTGETVRIVRGKNLLALQEASDDGELATAVMVRGGLNGGAFWNIGENAWELGAIPGSAPYWIPLTDFRTLASPIAFDDQVNGCYLLTKTGTTVEITDSRTSDGAVLVAATTGLVEGDLVQIVADSSATRLSELDNPAAKRLFREDTSFMSGVVGQRNIARNGDFWDTGVGYSVANWTVGANLTANYYLRSSPATFTMVGGNGGVSSTNITITSLTSSADPSGVIFYEGEWVRWGGTNYLLGATTFVTPTGGNLTLFTAAAVADGTTITEATTFRNLKAMTFPDDGVPSYGYHCWLTGGLRPGSQGDTAGLATYASSGANAITSAEFTVKYVAGITDYITAYSVWSVRTSIDLYNRDVSNVETAVMADTVYRNLPSMMLGTSTATQLARTLHTTRINANSESHFDLSLSYAISANQTFRLQCFPLVSKTTSSVDPDPACLLRYVTVTVSPSSSPTSVPIGDQPIANLFWHWGNRTLLARQLTSVNVRVSLLDLSRLAGFSYTRENITLGADVELVEIGITARVMGIVYDMINPENTQVVIDSRPTRLVKFLAENL